MWTRNTQNMRADGFFSRSQKMNPQYYLLIETFWATKWDCFLNETMKTEVPCPSSHFLPVQRSLTIQESRSQFWSPFIILLMLATLNELKNILLDNRSETNKTSHWNLEKIFIRKYHNLQSYNVLFKKKYCFAQSNNLKCITF